MVHRSPAMASQVIGMSCHAGRVPASLRSCLILTAHAHRKKPAVGAITKMRTKRMTRMELLRTPVRNPSVGGAGEDELKILKHTGSCAPDVALTVGHGVIAPLMALPDTALDLVVLLVEEVLQRHLEHVGDLARIRTGGESRAHDAHDRRDLVARAGAVMVDRADHLDKTSRQAHLLLGLAQRRRHRVSVGRLRAAAGKGDLAGMARHVVGALRQQDRYAGLAAHQWHENCSGLKSLRYGHDAVQGEIAAERRLGYGQAGCQTSASFAYPLHYFVNRHALVPAAFLGFPQS